jgi:2-succinyl-6-hydroxy-2,4-cyclohexadiene-1-carboxylate synthase
MEMKRMIKNLHGVPFHVEISGTGKPLLLLHGFTGSLDAWQFLEPSMERYVQLIGVDIIGHGRSGSPEDPRRYSMEEAALDLQKLLGQLHLAKADILGYSMGGRLALSFAMLHPECVGRLILESASPGLRTSRERAARRLHDRKLAERIRIEGMRSFVDFWENIPLFQSQQKLSEGRKQRVRDGRLANSVQGLSCSLIGMGTGSQPSWWDQLPRLTCPVLLVTGKEDAKFCRIAAEMEKRLHHAAWAVIPRAGHNTHLEQPGEFIRVIQNFLLDTNELPTV